MAEPPTSALAEARPVPGDAYVQSFARGLGVIRSFSADAPRQTITQVATATGLTRAGARRVLLTLQSLGYAATDGRLFWLTPKILDLGFSYLSSQPLWHLSEPIVEALVARVKDSSSIAVLDGHEIVYMLRVPTRKVMRVTLGAGSRLPAFSTSLGRTLLADFDDDALRALLQRHPPQALTEHTLTDPDALVAAVRQAKCQGFAVNDRELETGLVSIAAPIYDRAGRTVAAINVGAAYARDSIARLHDDVLPELLSAARDISALLQRT
ncbi:IclR family transcriptional regulator C-terminal domain-containing protein [Xylophilus sp. GOD-11R]|nr:IclR family transcriptional regulator C-terminal domain-containing protein [Xylophilus sp. GOD-11R]WPB55246.1 IclR family transcriptional regulator C-terminal domain-containing protein [Xylophilus sp. GOD-11R]